MSRNHGLGCLIDLAAARELRARREPPPAFVDPDEDLDRVARVRHLAHQLAPEDLQQVEAEILRRISASGPYFR